MLKINNLFTAGERGGYTITNAGKLVINLDQYTAEE
jgi:hypothetical protein